MIPHARLLQLLLSIEPDAKRLPPGWLAFARLVEEEAVCELVPAGWATPDGQLYQNLIAMPRGLQDLARPVYVPRLINTVISDEAKPEAAPR